MKDFPEYAKKQCLRHCFRFLILVYDKCFEIVDDIVAFVLVDRHCNRISEVKAENAHDRFGINNVSATGKVDFSVVFTNSINKIANIFDSEKANFYSFHYEYPQ